MTLHRTLLLSALIASAVSAQGAQHTRKAPAPAKPVPSAALPQLGELVPDTLLKRAAAKPCDVGEGRLDPCAPLLVGHNRITVAWDAETHRVTYLYSSTLDTDDDIRAGDILGIDPESPITPFPIAGTPHRFVTSDWCDTDRDISGPARWCAVMVPVRPKSGKVLGFVQSLYLYLPEFDSPAVHKTQTQPTTTDRSRRS